MGRGGSFSSGTRGHGGGVDVQGERSLVSLRNEGYREEADQALGVFRDIERQYGVVVEDTKVVKLSANDANTIAYYNYANEVNVNENFFNAERMDRAYDRNVEMGFHPSRGNKTGLEAVVAHEMGHRLNGEIAQRLRGSNLYLDDVANEIVKRASRRLGQKVDDLRSSISGYARQNNAETVAESFADVYCNGNRANRASIAVVRELNDMFYRESGGRQ